MVNYASYPETSQHLEEYNSAMIEGHDKRQHRKCNIFIVSEQQKRNAVTEAALRFRPVQ